MYLRNERSFKQGLGSIYTYAVTCKTSCNLHFFFFQKSILRKIKKHHAWETSVQVIDNLLLFFVAKFGFVIIIPDIARSNMHCLKAHTQ